MIQLTGVRKTYHNKNQDKVVLKGIEFYQETCGITMFLGASGCGKTTLFHIISGIERDYEGEVHVDGIGAYIQQEIQLMESMSVYDNLKLMKCDAIRLEALLKQFHLWEERKKKVKKLSTGQKKRVQVLQALLKTPDFLLCDEPTAALDHENAKMVMELLAEIAQTIPVLMVTHEQAIARGYADRICHIEDGRIVKDEIIHQKKVVEQRNQKDHKPSLSYLQLCWMSISARPWETCFHMLFLLVFIFALYAGGTFYFSTRNIQEQKSIWGQSENVLISQPKEENYYLQEDDLQNQYFEVMEEESKAFYYDTYTPAQIEKMMDQNEVLIGYRAGWKEALYAKFPMFVPMLDQVEAKQRIQAYEKQGYEDNWTVERLRKDLDDPLKIGYFDYFHLRGFYPNEMWAFSILDDLRSDALYMTRNEELPLRVDVVVYQLRATYALPLVYGNAPMEDHDIVLPYDLAKSLCMKLYGSEEVTQLLGQSIGLLLGNEAKEVQEDHILFAQSPQDPHPFTITGITSMENIQEYRIYMKQGAYDQYRNECYHMDDDELEYQYVTFLSDPSKDASDVAAQLNQTFPGENSSFVPQTYAKQGQVEGSLYKHPILFIVATLLILVCAWSIYLIYEAMVSKRKRKEEQILRNADYQPVILTLLEELCYVLPCIVVLPLGLPMLISQINSLARAYEYSDILSYSLPALGISILLGLCSDLIVRGVFYAMRIKKHK